MRQFGTHMESSLTTSKLNASNLNELLMFYKDGLRLSNIALLTNLLDRHALHEGNNLKGCLYFIVKGFSIFSLSKRRVASKTAFHVCIEIFVESAHCHVYHSSNVENSTTRKTN
jgi:hypothetical protein